MPSPRVGLAAAVLYALVSTPACLVLGLDHFYDDSTIVSDDRIVGTWADAEDNVTATVERAEWRSYRITYAASIARGVATAYLFRSHNVLYVDLTPVRGEDLGAFLVPGHTVARIAVGDAQVGLSPLALDWFRRAVDKPAAAGGLRPLLSERDQMVLAASGPELRKWLAARPATDEAFGPRATFTRQ